MRSLASYFSRIAYGACARGSKVLSGLSYDVTAALLVLLPRAAATYAGYPSLNDTNPSYDHFDAGSIDPNNPDANKIQADTALFSTATLGFWSASERVDAIRSGNNLQQCIGNLSVALGELGTVYQAGTAGATTLLTLVPAIGTLIGAPAMELLILYKLMPIAGMLSMTLSMGGNLVPVQPHGHGSIESFSEGDINSKYGECTRPTEHTKDGRTEADLFAAEIRDRALCNFESSKLRAKLIVGMLLQLLWLSFFIVACWFVQKESIVIWWCDMTYWAYFWLGFNVLSSILDQIAGVAASRQWTIRVSRAPILRIDPDAPWVVRGRSPRPHDQRKSSAAESVSEVVPERSTGSDSNDPEDIELLTMRFRRQPRDSRISYTGREWRDLDIFAGLRKGYNSRSCVTLDPRHSRFPPSDPFYVLIAIDGISPGHATLRMCSKLLSIGVLMLGTALFASTTFLTIQTASITAVLILVAGVFSRTTTIWMTDTLLQDKPVIQRIVGNEHEAEQLVDAMLRGVKDCFFEIEGHVVLNGRVIERFSSPLRRSTFLGLYAGPYNVFRSPAFRTHEPEYWLAGEQGAKRSADDIGPAPTSRPSEL